MWNYLTVAKSLASVWGQETTQYLCQSLTLTGNSYSQVISFGYN